MMFCPLHERVRKRGKEREGHVENYLFLAKIMNEPFRLQGKQRQRQREEGRELEAEIGNCEQVTATPK